MRVRILRGIRISSRVASKQTVMRKREHAGFVTPLQLMSLPNVVKSVTALKEIIVERSRVVGVKSDGMFTQGT